MADPSLEAMWFVMAEADYFFSNIDLLNQWYYMDSTACCLHFNLYLNIVLIVTFWLNAQLRFL